MATFHRLVLFSVLVTIGGPISGARAAVGDKLDLSGLIKAPTEDWSAGQGAFYTAATAQNPDVMWRTNWAAGGDRFANPSVDQVQMDAKMFPRARSMTVEDGPTSPTALKYDPFSFVRRPDGSRALRITPKWVPPGDRDKVFGYPIVSGVLMTAGRNVARDGSEKEFYASNYSVTVYHQVRLPLHMWTAVWQYPKADWGTHSATEVDMLETMRKAYPKLIWMSMHSDDAPWRAGIVTNSKTNTNPGGRFDPHITGWAGDRNVSLQWPGLATTSDPHALHDYAVVVGPKLMQWAVDGVVVFEIPTPADAVKLRHDIIDIGYPNEGPPPTSDADLDYFEIGKIDRYFYPGVSKVVWRQKTVGDGGEIPGATRTGGANLQASASVAGGHPDVPQRR